VKRKLAKAGSTDHLLSTRASVIAQRAMTRAAVRGLEIGEIVHVPRAVGADWLRSYVSKRAPRRYSVHDAGGWLLGVVRRADRAEHGEDLL